ncbi:hypothetical protein P7C73_g4989, partial [Tremellales sp. Uapishka_1]
MTDYDSSTSAQFTQNVDWHVASRNGPITNITFNNPGPVSFHLGSKGNITGGHSGARHSPSGARHSDSSVTAASRRRDTGRSGRRNFESSSPRTRQHTRDRKVHFSNLPNSDKENEESDDGSLFASRLPNQSVMGSISSYLSSAKNLWSVARTAPSQVRNAAATVYSEAPSRNTVAGWGVSMALGAAATAAYLSMGGRGDPEARGSGYSGLG